ncbi:MAG: PaaX family transcriptional regulator, partial [Nocardioides sp.]
MADRSPRHLILTLFGLYARDAPNWLSVRSLIALMTDLDVDAAATRSSVSRLKKRGVLVSSRQGGQAGYTLSEPALAVLAEGDARIWSRPRASVADGWLVVVFSVPELEREKRHELRSLLTRLGFGTAAPGVWVAPGTAYDETLAAVTR